jgi:prepilin-type N-terminal cleavage/methylation domain-containing protein
MRPRSSGGFTLLELLLALALMASLLSALFTFVFSMAEVWGHGAERRLFEQHANAVIRHLDGMLRRAALPAGGAGIDEPYLWREIKGLPAGTQRLLCFDLPEGDRLMRWPGPPLPQVRCALAADPGRGLTLYWRSVLEPEEDSRPRAVVVSPLVTRLEYLHFDPAASNWLASTLPVRDPAGLWRVPDRLKLTFSYGGNTLERTITLPLAPGGVPTF